MNALNWKNSQGIELYAAHWPVANPIAVIALAHGQGEHIGRYQHVAEWYNAHGVAVVGFDHQGYGRSGGPRGHVKDLDAFLDDIGLLLEKTAELYPDKPLFLYGHSMGGNLVLNYALRRKPELKGLIATSPWIQLAFEAPAIKVLVGKLMRKFMPTLTLPTNLAAHFISQDKAVVEAYKNDPLVHDKISAAAGIALMDAADWLDSYKGEVPMPLLLLHGTGDKIISPVATKAFAERVKGDVTHQEWDGLYHELHNENEKAEVFEYTFNWMKQHLPAN